MDVGRSGNRPIRRFSARRARLLVRLGYFLGKTGAKGFSAATLPLLEHPVVLGNRKLRREIGFSFQYNSAEAVSDHVLAVDAERFDHST
jgi:hypothetical protein